MSKRKPPKSPRHANAPASRPKRAARRPRPGAREGPDAAPGTAALWLYGTHAVLEALANPRRRVTRLLVAAEAAAKEAPRLEPLLAGRADGLGAEPVTREALAQLLPEAAVHQGLALRVLPLDQPDLPALLANLSPPGDTGRPLVVVALDQVTDPRNVGAILRSAAAFGATAAVAPQRHAAPESGALAKAASGALEHLAYLQVGNLARALDQLKEAGFWILGLAAEGATTIAEADAGARIVLVLGAEGSGLRRLTRERCDLLVRLPTGGAIGQLNVSNAAAVALYELLGRRA
jgi:23S rRNA (guanosine2251-2'-O)-methyltransferase